MKRIFYAEPGALWQGRREYTVLPHNHRQDITLTGLFGDALNCSFDIAIGADICHNIAQRGSPELSVVERQSRTVYKYRFESALLTGQFKLTRIPTPYRVCRIVETPLMRGSLYLPAHVIHNVVAHRESAWLIEEGQTSSLPVACYSKLIDKKLNSEGLYIPMSDGDLNELWDLIVLKSNKEVMLSA